jgi:hypothetical protein
MAAPPDPLMGLTVPQLETLLSLELPVRVKTIKGLWAGSDFTDGKNFPSDLEEGGDVWNTVEDTRAVGQHASVFLGLLRKLLPEEKRPGRVAGQEAHACKKRNESTNPVHQLIWEVRDTAASCLSKA